MLRIKTRKARGSSSLLDEPAESDLRHQAKSLAGEIADLEKLLCRIPEAAARRRLREIEAMHTIPPPEIWDDEEATPELAMPRRHVEAMRRQRRRSFLVFLFVALGVAASAHYLAEFL